MRIAIAGDLHGSWSAEDHEILDCLAPDVILFVGDLGESDLKAASLIKKLSIPTAVILGNHDRGRDGSGEFLKAHIGLLGELHCAWDLRRWKDIPLSVVGGRVCSAGGGFYLSKEVESLFGPMSIEQSVDEIVNACNSAPLELPLIILAHSGPTGLGSNAHSICGRDWKSPSLDWGDKDLELAIIELRKKRLPDLVVFGHMHHKLKSNNKYRDTFFQDKSGIKYLNAACVPRKFYDEHGHYLIHFSWVECEDQVIKSVSHRWFKKDGSLAYKEELYLS